MKLLTERPVLRLGLAVVWMMASGEFTLGSFVTGLIMATLVFAVLAAPVVRLAAINTGGFKGFFPWLYWLTHLVVYFLWELGKANRDVILRAIRPRLDIKPGVLAMKMRAPTAERTALLAALITLTPGTLVFEVSDDHRIIYIHTIDASEPESVLQAPRRFEELIMEVLK